MAICLVYAGIAAAARQYCTTGKIGHHSLEHSLVHGQHIANHSAHERRNISGIDVGTVHVCCPTICDRCGGTECWLQRGGSACCVADIIHLRNGTPCQQPTDVSCVLPKLEPDAQLAEVDKGCPPRGSEAEARALMPRLACTSDSTAQQCRGGPCNFAFVALHGGEMPSQREELPVFVADVLTLRQGLLSGGSRHPLVFATTWDAPRPVLSVLKAAGAYSRKMTRPLALA